MKKIILITLISLIVSSCEMIKNEDDILDINFVVQSFEQPQQEYKTGPLWAWNYKITKPEIDFQLEELKKQGMGCVFIHPRPGMITEYLNDEWFEIIRYAYDKANSLGMKVWLYDENSYPSGFAGGHVRHDMPKSYNQGIALSQTKVNILPKKVDTFAYVLYKKGNKFIDITNNIENYSKQKGEFVSVPILEIGNTNSRYKFSIGAREFVEQWSTEGPAHHLAVGIGHISSKIIKLANLLNIEYKKIC